MKVKELIDQLQDFDASLEVFRTDGENIKPITKVELYGILGKMPVVEII